MSIISGIFYGPDLLKSSVGSKAAYNHLTSMLHYRQLQAYMPEVAAEALATWNRHLDYITPQHIILALVCDDFSVEQRERLARALLLHLPARVMQLPPTRVVYPGPNFPTNNLFWPEGNGLPDISQFATLDSFLIPNIMEMPSTELQEWLESPVEEWSQDPSSPHLKASYRAMLAFADRTQFTNDAAER